MINCENDEELPETLAKTQTTAVEEIKRKSTVRKTPGTPKTRQNQHGIRKRQVIKQKQIKTPHHNGMAEKIDQITLEQEQLIKKAQVFMFLPPVEIGTSRQKNCHTCKKSREKNEGLSDSETGDSGVASGSSGSLEGHGDSSGSGKGGGGGGGNVPGGGSGGGGDMGGWRERDKGEGGGGGDDDDKEKQWWRNGGQLIDDSEEENMETDEDDEVANESQLDNKVPIGIQPENGKTEVSKKLDNRHYQNVYLETTKPDCLKPIGTKPLVE